MKKVICFGEVMLRLATPNYQRFDQAQSFELSFGGGEANVAASLAGFQIPAAFVTRLPDNDLGNACKHYFNELGVDTKSMVFGGERLGLYYLETGAVARGSKVVYDRQNSSFASIKKGMIDWKEVFREAQWFHWTGIIPAISLTATEVLEEALEVAELMGVKVSCDVNYRSHLWKSGSGADARQVMPRLIAKTDVLIGNEFDAEKVLCVDHPVEIKGEYSNESFKNVSKALMQQYPRIKQLITTRRGTISANHNSWRGLLYDGNKLWESPVYQITHIVDRVGGGDALMAGLIYGFVKFPQDAQQIIDFAIAASFIKHTVSGDINFAQLDEVKKLLKGEIQGRIDW